ncbi:MAG: hypothetical protein KIS77_05905 [Saprospiraceae bacterium]|nr:hypothetical protein [Saprospiraceae bacterium]
MKKWLLLLPLTLIGGIDARAQQHDRFWITGYSLNGLPPYLSNVIDFVSSPPTVTATVIPIETVGATCAMSDAGGNLLFYTNGGQVRNKNHQLIENGDSLNVSPGEYPGLNGTQAAYPLTSTLLILPGTHNKDWYHIIHLTHVWCGPALPGICKRPLLHTLVDMSANNGAGKVVFKNKILYDTWAMDKPIAVKHANGRDWWIMMSDHLTDLHHTLLFNDMGVIDSFTQVAGYKPDPAVKRDAGGNNVFSPDGSVYVDSDSRNGHRIFDFDRCTGRLSNFRWIQLPAQQPFGGAAISPNSRFLYITASVWAMQYDLWETDVAASVDTVAVWDGFCSPCPSANTTFGECQLGMNGKIYVIPNNSVYHINYIESPDVKGVGCNFVQHGFELPNLFVLATPVHPNYRLGALAGSPCDTLTVSANEATKPHEGLRLYPSPAQERAVLELPETWTRHGAAEYRLYNTIGALARGGTVAEGTKTVFVPLAGLPGGLYVCQVWRDGRVLGASKLSIVR